VADQKHARINNVLRRNMPAREGLKEAQ